jgi:hypothetical protein
VTSFADLTDAFLQEEFDDAPVRASSLGLTEYDDQQDREVEFSTAWRTVV